MRLTDSEGLALERLHKRGILLIADGWVHMRAGRPAAWHRVVTLESLQDLDLATSLQGDPLAECRSRHRSTEAAFVSLLPEKCRKYGLSILTFCVQAERYRTGRPSGPFMPAILPRGNSLPAQALVAPTAVIRRGRVYVPQRRLCDPVTELPAHSERAIMAAVRPDAMLTLQVLLANCTRLLKMYSEAAGSTDEEVHAALKAVRETIARQRRELNCDLIYDCAETGLSSIVRPDGVPLFMIASEPFIGEDAEGRLYRFGAFRLAVQPSAGPLCNAQLAGTPRVVDPPQYRHWHPKQLHMCTYLPERPIHSSLQMDNCISLLLSGRHLLRAGLFGPHGLSDELEDSLSALAITREEAKRSDLPIYPFHRVEAGKRGIGSRIPGHDELRRLVEQIRSQVR